MFTHPVPTSRPTLLPSIHSILCLESPTRPVPQTARFQWPQRSEPPPEAGLGKGWPHVPGFRAITKPESGGVRGESGLNHSASTKKTNPDARGREAWELEQTPGNSHPYKAGSKAEGRKPPTPHGLPLPTPWAQVTKNFSKAETLWNAIALGRAAWRAREQAFLLSKSPEMNPTEVSSITALVWVDLHFANWQAPSSAQGPFSLLGKSGIAPLGIWPVAPQPVLPTSNPPDPHLCPFISLL